MLACRLHITVGLDRENIHLVLFLLGLHEQDEEISSIRELVHVTHNLFCSYAQARVFETGAASSSF